MNTRLLLSLCVASALSASTLIAHADVGVELTLSLDAEEGYWEVYGVVVDPANQTLGLHGFEMDVLGAGEYLIEESFLEAPMASELDLGSGKRFDKGFIIGLDQGSQGMGIRALQSDRNRLSTADTGRNNILEHVGKFAFTEPNEVFGPVDIGFPVLLASGWYGGATGALSVISDPSRVTVLPPTLPTPTEGGAAFEPLRPAYVRGHTIVPTGSVFNTRSVRIGRLTVGGSMAIMSASSGGGTSVLNSLEIADGGRLDLRDNALIVDYDTSSPMASIETQIASGYAVGQWNGQGLISTAADATTYALGFAEASHALGPNGGTFAGETVDGTAVLVRHTYYGDANLSGTVTIADFGALRNSFGRSGRNWSGGDFDYNGTVTISDFGKLRANFGAGISGEPIARAALASKVNAREPMAAASFVAADEVGLMVDLMTGRVKLVGPADDPAEMTGYEIISASRGLVPSQFSALSGQGYDEWVTLIASEGYLAEGNLTSFVEIDSTGIDLGDIFKTGGVRDLVFNWTDENGVAMSGSVMYSSIPEPAAMSLAAAAGAAMLLRRRNRDAA